MAEVVEWRGPAPYLFAPLPPELCEEVADVAAEVSYGWGVVPVVARSGTTTWTTSLFPKDGGYLLPVKVAVQRADGVGLGDLLDVHLLIGEP